MTLEVWTSRISTKDPDALNITRKSGDPTFSPSWKLLRTMLDIRKDGTELSDDEWKEVYAKPYLKEMAASKRLNPEAWRALLGRRRVVLTCYCVKASRCHRTLLGRILGVLGADFKGELELAEREASWWPWNWIKPNLPNICPKPSY
jgi:hypothetical protein